MPSWWFSPLQFFTESTFLERFSKIRFKFSEWCYTDVGVRWCWCSLMLVTVRLICCFLWIFSMLIASFECWLPMPTLKYTRFCQNWEKPSPTFFSYQYTFSDIRQQHRCNPRRFWHLLVRTHLSTIVSLNLFLDTNSCHFSVCSNDLTTLGFFSSLESQGLIVITP